MSFPSDSPTYRSIEPWMGKEEGTDLIFEWHDIGRLQNVIIKPSFLCDRLVSLPDGPVHVVHLDR
jgi:hypothetical protein